MASRNTPADPRKPFLASRLKLKRAARHIAELEETIERHQATYHPGPELKEPQFVRPDGYVRLGGPATLAPPPEDFGAIVGDVIHNLRAALDLMACHLVRIGNGDGHADNVCFPFCNTEEDLDGMIKRRNFHLAGQRAIDLLKTYKPFRGGNIALRAIHDLDIRDKHRSLIPVVTMLMGQQFQMYLINGRPAAVPTPGRGPRTCFKFPDGPFAGDEIVPTLHELMKLTAGIVEAFEALSAL